jgi:hypothetical protein
MRAAHRACVAAMRNAHSGPELGIVYDWEFIMKDRTALYEFA